MSWHTQVEFAPAPPLPVPALPAPALPALPALPAIQRTAARGVSAVSTPTRPAPNPPAAPAPAAPTDSDATEEEDDAPADLTADTRVLLGRFEERLDGFKSKLDRFDTRLRAQAESTGSHESVLQEIRLDLTQMRSDVQRVAQRQDRFDGMQQLLEARVHFACCSLRVQELLLMQACFNTDHTTDGTLPQMQSALLAAENRLQTAEDAARKKGIPVPE